MVWYDGPHPRYFILSPSFAPETLNLYIFLKQQLQEVGVGATLAHRILLLPTHAGIQQLAGINIEDARSKAVYSMEPFDVFVYEQGQ
jgi:hypothetical protein